MMFDDILKRVNALDWPSLGTHIYYTHTKFDIPNAFKRLAVADKEAARGILGFLMGNEQDTGSVAHTTPYIVPFLLDFLKAGFPHPEAILNRLAATCIYYVQHGISIQEMRYRLRIHEAVLAELDLLHEFLQAPDASVRREAAYLLRCFSDKAEIVGSWLRTRYTEESELSVKKRTLCSLCTLITNLPNYDKVRKKLEAEYSPFYEEITASETELLLRKEAARAFLVFNLIRLERDKTPKTVVEALVEGFVLNPENDIDIGFYRTEHIEALWQQPLWYWRGLLKPYDYPPEYASRLRETIRGWVPIDPE